VGQRPFAATEHPSHESAPYDVATLMVPSTLAVCRTAPTNWAFTVSVTANSIGAAALLTAVGDAAAAASLALKLLDSGSNESERVNGAARAEVDETDASASSASPLNDAPPDGAADASAVGAVLDGAPPTYETRAKQHSVVTLA